MTDNIRIINNPELPEDLARQLDGAVLLDPDTLDVAIVGVHLNAKGEACAVYDHDLLVTAFAENEFAEDEDPTETAIEWVGYNTLRALPYAGERAPVVVYEVDEHDPDEDACDGDVILIGGKTYKAV